MGGAPSRPLPRRRDGVRGLLSGGLKKLDEYTEPHRPSKIIYSSLYADVKPSFIVDISAQFERRMTALLSYISQYGEMAEGSALFPERAGDPRAAGRDRALLRQPDRRAYGEPFVVKETMRDRRHRGDAGAVDLGAFEAALRFHYVRQNRVDAGQMTGPLDLQPLQDVFLDPEGDQCGLRT